MEHTQKVEKIQREIREKNRKVTLQRKKPSNTLHDESYKKNLRELDLSSFDEILEIDPENLTATVEPKVTLEKLLKATLKKGLIPLVLPEFRSITVGGAIMGSALESSSHLYGQFNDSCLEMEILCGDGQKVIATPTLNSELFYGVVGSYGTLGILTLVKLRLKKAAPYVLLQYNVFSNPSDLLSFFQEKKSDFLEGFALSENRFVGISALLTNEKSQNHHKSRNYASEWFIDHVSDQQNGFEETMALEDYLFRLDRGGFWIGGYLRKWSLLLRSILNIRVEAIAAIVKKTPISLNASLLYRLFFGWAYSSKNLYKIWHKVPKEILEDLFLIHDFYAPVEKFEETYSYFQKKTSIYPVWLCPIKGTMTEQFLSPHFGKEHFINMGFYGIPKNGGAKELTRELERKIVAQGGKKMLYSYATYTQEEFAKIYDQTRYENLRKKYGADKVFPSLYEKVCS